jgi:small ligand-binding sensory domain FIST
MPFAASHNTLPDSRQAAEAACRALTQQLQGATPDVLLLFVSAHHAGCEELPQIVQEALQARQLVGCTCETVIGGGEELESRPALSLWAGVLPGVPVHSFHVAFERTPDGLMCTGLPGADELDAHPSAAILLGDPYTCAVDSVISRWGDDFAGMPVMGGMASGADSPGENCLFWGSQTLHHGGVGLLFGPGVSLRTVVSQGCRPVGTRFVVTKADRNVVFELGGKPAMLRLQEVYDAAPQRDQALLQRGPHVGIAISETRGSFDRGDFLIANVIGGDRESGALALGNFARVGQTVQFHVRDADAADEDLRELLGNVLKEGSAPQGALLFSCNGRGTRMFPRPHHDAGVVQQLAGPVPLAGFFAQGEIGPISGKNHLHGFTASLALFEAPPDGERRGA